MPESVNGLPLHPLVVHAIVVLLPLAALGVIALAVRPAWRGRFGPLVIAVTAVATGAIPLATESGENLERSVGDPGRHAELGDTLIWFAVPLLLAAVGLVALHYWSARQSSPARRSAMLAIPAAVLAVLIAAANLVQVYRIGESGARAVWGRTANQAQSTLQGPDRHGPAPAGIR